MRRTRTEVVRLSENLLTGAAAQLSTYVSGLPEGLCRSSKMLCRC